MAPVCVLVVYRSHGAASVDLKLNWRFNARVLLSPAGKVSTICETLGVVSIFQRRRYRGLPIAGLAINVLLGLFVLLITVPSLLHELSR